MNLKNLTCIECPRGCQLNVVIDDDNLTVTGNLCPKGKVYAREEITAPIRTVTSTVRLASGEMLPVKTNYGIPKDKVLEIMQIINTLHPFKPIKKGDILYENIFEKVNLVSTKSIK